MLPVSSAARVAERGTSARGRSAASHVRVAPRSRRSGRRTAPGSRSDRSRRPRRRRRPPERAGPRAARRPRPATRPGRSAPPRRAGPVSVAPAPRTPGVTNVIDSSVPPPSGTRRSTSAASRPIVGSPSPRPGLSGRGRIPTPVVGDDHGQLVRRRSAALTRTVPGSRSMNACSTALVTASVTASATSIRTICVDPVRLGELAHRGARGRDALGLGRQLPFVAGGHRSRHRPGV